MARARSKIFLFCLLAFVAGVGAASFWLPDFIYIYSATLLTVVALFFLWTGHLIYRVIALTGLFFILGIWRFALAVPDKKSPEHIGYYNGQNVVATGVVAEEPDVRLDSQRLTMGIKSVETRHGASLQNISGRLLIKTSLYPQYQYGDLLKIKCQIEAPGKIEDFDYDKYLARYDVYSVCWRGEIEKIDSDKGNRIKAGILSVKARFMGAVNHALPEPHASLLSGILIGARKGIPEYLLEAFNRVGVTHIIAISGTNITIIAAVLIILVQMLALPRRYNFWLVSIAIALFVIMTGASSSVVRAGVMGVFVLLARQLGRPSRATNALVFTAFVMLLINPKILVFDAGFQLSFLATMGLVYINPVLQNYTRGWGNWLGLKEILVTTFSAIIMTTPLILYLFGRFSLVAPLANLLIVPFIPLIMALGFITGFIGLVWNAAGALLGWTAWLVLEYIIRAAEWLGSWPLASLELGEFHWILMLSLYVLIGWVIFRVTRKQTVISNPSLKKIQ